MKDDMISRQAAIDAIGEVHPLDYNAQAIKTRIESLPSAQPMQKKGWWQEITASDCSGYDPTLAGYDDPVVGCICSVCREGYEKELMGEVYWNYCPNCGAEMRGDPNE